MTASSNLLFDGADWDFGKLQTMRRTRRWVISRARPSLPLPALLAITVRSTLVSAQRAMAFTRDGFSPAIMRTMFVA